MHFCMHASGIEQDRCTIRHRERERERDLVLVKFLGGPSHDEVMHAVLNCKHGGNFVTIKVREALKEGCS
jgi:hypothetical protein